MEAIDWKKRDESSRIESMVGPKQRFSEQRRETTPWRMASLLPCYKTNPLFTHKYLVIRKPRLLNCFSDFCFGGKGSPSAAFVIRWLMRHSKISSSLCIPTRAKNSSRLARQLKLRNLEFWNFQAFLSVAMVVYFGR